MTSVVFLLWLADWRPYHAIAVAIGMAVPILLIVLVAKVVERLR
jgi:hypothetical protein